jgi:hypothetical protein
MQRQAPPQMQQQPPLMQYRPPPAMQQHPPPVMPPQQVIILQAPPCSMPAISAPRAAQLQLAAPPNGGTSQSHLGGERPWPLPLTAAAPSLQRNVRPRTELTSSRPPRPAAAAVTGTGPAVFRYISDRTSSSGASHGHPCNLCRGPNFNSCPFPRPPQTTSEDHFTDFGLSSPDMLLLLGFCSNATLSVCYRACAEAR